MVLPPSTLVAGTTGNTPWSVDGNGLATNVISDENHPQSVPVWGATTHPVLEAWHVALQPGSGFVGMGRLAVKRESVCKTDSIVYCQWLGVRLLRHRQASPRIVPC